MKYESEILKGFKRLSFVPRPFQVEACNKVLIEFVDNKKTNVILNAGTGSGKSIIGLVIAEVLSDLTNDGGLKSVVSMHQNSLVDQYGNTFKSHDNVIQIKGASNYKCSIMDDTAEQCIQSSMNTLGIGQELCRSCEYKKLKSQRNSISHLITNFSFAFVDRMFADILDPRLIYIWDEAHTLNEVFVEHNSIYISDKRISSFQKDLIGHDIESNVSSRFQKLSLDITSGKVNDNTYIKFIEELNKIYSSISQYFESASVSFIKSNRNKFVAMTKLSKKYKNLSCKISDLLQYNYEHIFEINDMNEISIKAVFIGSMFDVIRNSKYNLFMSATISKDYMNTTMKLDKNTTAFIKLPPVFPKENKEVVFVKPLLKLNYSTMKDPKIIKSIKDSVLKLVKFHTQQNESGIILVPSFVMGEMISTELKKHKLNTKIFEHMRGEKIGISIEAFKKYSGNSVLISPSIFEGIDLADDFSRFQIIAKVPWPSLGEKRMKFIADNHKEVYKAITLHKLVQGLGRSVRNENDYSTTYILDEHGETLLNGPANIWFDEFEFKNVELK